MVWSLMSFPVSQHLAEKEKACSSVLCVFLLVDLRSEDVAFTGHNHLHYSLIRTTLKSHQVHVNAMFRLFQGDRQMGVPRAWQ